MEGEPTEPGARGTREGPEAQELLNVQFDPLFPVLALSYAVIDAVPDSSCTSTSSIVNVPLPDQAR